MHVIEAPKANPENLLSIIRDAYNAKVVLPEFQRSFVWTREDIEELLVSILQGYFIGTFLILDTPTDKPMFPFRTVEGFEEVNSGTTPHHYPTVRLVLDGQQRISSLFYVLFEPSISLKNTKNPYRFFFRLDLALDVDPSDAIYGISLTDRKRMAEMEKLIQEHRAIPFSLLKDASRFYRWFYTEQKFLKSEDEKALIETFYHRFEKFMVPVVALSPEAGKGNIVNIFERINRTGISLSLFDLAVARLYLKDVLLRELWDDFVKQNDGIAEVVKPEFLLKVIALLGGKEIRKGTLLDIIDVLDKSRFERQWLTATKFIVEAYNRITAPQGGYGAYNRDLVPYTTMVVPLAVLLHAVTERKGGEGTYRKVDRWYWASIFTQRYDQAVDSTTYRDVKDIIHWLDDENPPKWLSDFSPVEVNLEVDEPRSALYRGLLCCVVLSGARDFINGQAANLKECQDDHIFPFSKFRKHPFVNSILNRTLISPETNKSKGNKKPSEYLPIFLQKHGNDMQRLRDTLKSHLISEEGLKAMERDDLDTFIMLRKKEFLTAVEKRLEGIT